MKNGIVGKHCVHIKDSGSKHVEISHNRLHFIIILFTIAFMVVSLRVVDVSAINSEPTNISDIENELSAEQLTRRADIVDRNGVILATSLITASVYANPKVMLDKELALKKLVSVFPDLDRQDITEKFNSKKSFVWIKRNLTPSEQYKVNALGIPGVYFRNEERRIYPHRNLFAHEIGFVNVDGKGTAGLEKQYNNYLTRKYNEFSGDENETPLTLSLDIRVQNIVRDALLDSVNTFEAKGGSAIVIDVTSGEVLSMVSLPDFDPNQPSLATGDEMFNRVTYGVYEMGSTFKTFNMAMAFDNKTIKWGDEYDVGEPIRIGGFSIRDYHQKSPILTVSEIYMHSSNIGSAKIAVDAGVETQRAFLKKLGLLDELSIEVPEKGTPLVPETWSKIRSMTVSYGHGIAVTPMHVAAATAALVNGGIYYPATLIKKDATEVYGERVVSIKTSDKIRRLMRLAVQYGTGAKADVASYIVGGKTGSADKAVSGGYNRKAIMSSFVGAFPMNKPKYVVFAMLDEPIGNKSTGGYATGGMVAAPVVRKIISRIAPMLDVMPVDENGYEIKKEFFYENNIAAKHQLVSAKTY